MAQVTMDGKEYVELIGKVNAAESENQLLIQTLIMGTLEVDPDTNYRRVMYKVQAELPDTDEMQLYMQLRINDVTEKLGQNPLAVQLLYDEGNNYFNPLTGYFTSYGWDNNVELKSMSKTLGNMYESLEAGVRLVEEEEEETKEEE